MKQNRFRVINILLGLLVGGIVAFLIYVQGNYIVVYLVMSNHSSKSAEINVICTAIIVPIFYLIMRYFISIQRKKLTLYLIFSVLTAFLLSILFPLLIVRIVSSFFSITDYLAFLDTEFGQLLVYNLGFYFIMLIIAIFIITFMIFVNRKVKYIQYISSEVKKIETEGFGRKILVKGNDELSELSTVINTMSVTIKEKIEQEKQIEQNKNELITSVSHDLRTPLTSIMGYVTLVQKNGFDDKEKFVEYMDVIDRRLKNLNTQINELFEYTKLNSLDFSFNIKSMDFIPVIDHFISEYFIILEKEGYNVLKQMECNHCVLQVDTEKMIRVLQNLFDNARKYAKPNSLIFIKVWEDDQQLHMELNNTINEYQNIDVNKLFERFYKGESSRTQENSSGLGLSIVKRIVELHHGSIDSKLEDDNICFHIAIPKE